MTSLELVGASGNGDRQLYGEVLVLVVLLLLFVEVHQVDHVALVAVPLLRLRDEGVLEILLAIATLAANLIHLIHVIAILVYDLGLCAHASTRSERLRVIRL
jgi:hypothetical protein